MPITKRGLANVEARQLTYHLTQFDAIFKTQFKLNDIVNKRVLQKIKYSKSLLYYFERT